MLQFLCTMNDITETVIISVIRKLLFSSTCKTCKAGSRQCPILLPKNVQVTYSRVIWPLIELLSLWACCKLKSNYK